MECTVVEGLSSKTIPDAVFFTESAPRAIQSISCDVRDRDVCLFPVTPKRRGMETSSQKCSSLNSQKRTDKNIFFYFINHEISISHITCDR